MPPHPHFSRILLGVDPLFHQSTSDGMVHGTATAVDESCGSSVEKQTPILNLVDV